MGWDPSSPIPPKEHQYKWQPHHSCLWICLEIHFFYQGIFYKQVEVVAMDSPLSPVVAEFFMEAFEQRAHGRAPLKPLVYCLCVDDTFNIWQHGKQALEEFMIGLNNICSSIKFTKELEQDGKLAFLDIQISRHPDTSLSRTVYRKAMHTYLLNGDCRHHPSQMLGIFMTLL